jgi:hypothetical protein
MSSSIPSRYFIDSSTLSPWILLPRVHKVKDEDSILDCGFIGFDEDITTSDTTIPSIELQGPIMRS